MTDQKTTNEKTQPAVPVDAVAPVAQEVTPRLIVLSEGSGAEPQRRVVSSCLGRGRGCGL